MACGPELARRQAERYGIPFLLVTPNGGFLGMVEKRQMWPDAKRRLSPLPETSRT